MALVLLVCGGLGLVAGLVVFAWTWWRRPPFYGVPSLFTMKAGPSDLDALYGRVVRHRGTFLVLADVTFIQTNGLQAPASGEIVIDVNDLAWVQVGVSRDAVAAARQG
jgi:hypothetical protein